MGERQPLTATECAALGLLSFGEASGYDLMKLAERSIGLMWQPVKSQLYALLPRFVERGLAESRFVPQRGRPNKVLYRLTDAGREALRTSLIALEPEGRTAPAIFNLKVFFGDIVGADHVRETIEARRRWAAERRALLRQIESRTDADEDFFPLLTLELGVEALAAFERWSKRVLSRLDERAAVEAGGKRGSRR